MADYDMNALLKSYGAPMSAKNANLAREFFAANPELAAHRAMGMRGSIVDDNSDLLNAMLDHTLAQTDAVPPGRVEVGQPQLSSPPTARPIPRSGGPSSSPASGMGPSLPMRNPALHDELSGSPAARGNNSTSQYDYGIPTAAEVSTQGPTGGLNDYILALLGLSSTAGRAAMSGNTPDQGTPGRASKRGVSDVIDQNDRSLSDSSGGQKGLPTPSRQIENKPNAPLDIGNSLDALEHQPKIENNAPSTVTNSPELNAEGKARTDRYAKMQAEVDAENEAIMRQIMEQNKQRAAQTSTRDLLNATGKYLGRRK